MEETPDLRRPLLNSAILLWFEFNSRGDLQTIGTGGSITTLLVSSPNMPSWSRPDSSLNSLYFTPSRRLDSPYISLLCSFTFTMPEVIDSIVRGLIFMPLWFLVCVVPSKWAPTSFEAIYDMRRMLDTHNDLFFNGQFVNLLLLVRFSLHPDDCQLTMR